MRHSLLQDTNPTRDYIDSFGGYNHNLQINENEFYDMQNLTSDNYPVLSPRKKRGVYKSLDGGTYNLLYGKDFFVYIKNTSLYDGLDTSASPTALINFAVDYKTPTQIVSIGSYLILMPNKRYVNMADTSDSGKIEAKFEMKDSGTITYTMCKVDGTNYSVESENISSTPPADPANGDLWIDTSEDKHVLKQYAADSGIWIQIPTTYIKISAPGIAADFKQYDAVKITGISGSLTQLKDLEGQVSPIWEIHHDTNTPANDYIVVVGILDTASTQTLSSSDTFTVSRDMPDMDFVVESGNRLWGCKFKKAQNPGDETINEIYASKLGDFKNWNCFMGISTDSYAATVGSYGEFTGAITHLGYPIFFKENTMHKVYGNYPANFQIQTTTVEGVQKGAGNSLAIVKDVLYYKSRNGVMRYDGSLPQNVSYALGDIHYTAVDTHEDAEPLFCGAVAGAIGSKYYINMRSEADNKWYTFVYDTSKGMWHKEAEGRTKSFAQYNEELYFIDTQNTKIKTVNGTGTAETNPVEWYAESGIITYPYTKYGPGKSPDNKYISKINIRMSLNIGATVRFYCQYDSTGEWEHIYTMTGTTLRSFNIPIRPKRCDHLRLRIEGVGDAKIYSIAKTFEQGSDVV